MSLCQRKFHLRQRNPFVRRISIYMDEVSDFDEDEHNFLVSSSSHSMRSEPTNGLFWKHRKLLERRSRIIKGYWKIQR